MTDLKIAKAIGKNQAIVLNSGMEITGVVDWTRAVNLVLSGEAYTLIPRGNGEIVRSPNLEIEKPLVVCLFKYVRSRFNDVEKTHASRNEIFLRDKWTCQYCGDRGTTLDHIFPKSRGGGNTWGNLCVACLSCNGKKRDRTPDEAGMITPHTYGAQKVESLQSAVYDDLALV